LWIRLLRREARRGRKWEEDRSPEKLKPKVKEEAEKRALSPADGEEEDPNKRRTVFEYQKSFIKG